MKAALLFGPNDIKVTEVENPEISKDEVLIKIKMCGICPTDIRFYKGIRKPIDEFPCILGHEWTGEIIEIREKVRKFKKGDRVAVNPRVICRKCYYCTKGESSCCVNVGYGGVKGGFSEYGKAINSNIHIIPENISYEEAVFAEPLACCINGINKSSIQQGDDVVIIGAGPMGLLHVQLAKHRGARVIVSELIKDRLEVAKKLGADEIINPNRENLVEKINELTENRGVNVTVLAIGIPELVSQAINITGTNGIINIFAGLYPPTKIGFDFNIIHSRQLSVVGSRDFNSQDFSTALKLLECGTIKVKPLIKEVYPLHQIKKAFDIVYKKSGLKGIIKCSE